MYADYNMQRVDFEQSAERWKSQTKTFETRLMTNNDCTRYELDKSSFCGDTNLMLRYKNII